MNCISGRKWQSILIVMTVVTILLLELWFTSHVA